MKYTLLIISFLLVSSVSFASFSVFSKPGANCSIPGYLTSTTSSTADNCDNIFLISKTKEEKQIEFIESNIEIIGFSVKDEKHNQEEKVFKLARLACEYINCEQPQKKDVLVFDGYVGGGYGVPTEGMKEAVKLMATREGILLDPVYSGKGFDGLMDLVSKKYFKDTDKLLFIHTGGAASLHAYEWAF